MCRDCENDSSLIDSMYADYSRIKGLIPPEEESAKFFQMCGCGGGIWIHGVKVDSPSLVELQLSTRPHRWPRMRQLHKDFFDAIAKEITDWEDDMLKALKLPNIEKVREAEAGEDVTSSKIFEFTPTMKLAHTRITKELMKDLIGDEEFETDAQKEAFINFRKSVFTGHKQTITPGMANSIFGYFFRSALGIGLDEVWKQLVANLPPGLTEEDLDKTRVLAQLENRYFLAAVEAGADRVRHALSVNHRDAIRQGLAMMSKENKTIIEAARYIHKQAGEGNLWHWNRVARSESSLMANAALNVQAREAGYNFVKWSSAANACPICIALNNRQWRLGEAPEPVQDSHPFCLCILVPLYRNTKPLQNSWERPSPYDQRYTPDELSNLNNTLNQNREGPLPLNLPQEQQPIISEPTVQIVNNEDDAKRAMDELFKNATDEEKAIVKSYTSEDYADWNDYLRNQKTGNKKIDSKTKELNKFLNKAPKFETNVYRGMSFDYDRIETWSKFANMKPGDVFTDNGFVSTSMFEHTARDFANEAIESGGGNAVILNIKSKNGVLLNKFSDNPIEQEVLFRNGTSFKVVGKRMGDSFDVIVLDLEEI